MKKLLIIMCVLALIPIVYSLQECNRVNDPSNFPCYIKSSWRPAGTNCDIIPIDFLNETGDFIQQLNWTNLTPSIDYCQALFNISNLTMQTYSYNSTIEDGFITMRFGDMTPIAIIILLPAIFGIIIFIGAMKLGDEHPAFKWFAFLLMPVTLLASFHFAALTVVKYYIWEEMQDLIGTTIYWIGLLIILIVVYAFMYSFVVMTRKAAQEKEARIEY